MRPNDSRIPTKDNTNLPADAKVPFGSSYGDGNYALSGKANVDKGVDHIHNLPEATEADLKAGNYFALDGAEGTKRLPAELVAKGSDVAILLTPSKEFAVGVSTENFELCSTQTYTNGIFDKLVGNENYKTSDYIDVTYINGVFIKLNDPYNANLHLVEFYDGDKNFICALKGGIPNSSLNVFLKLSVPDACKFARYSVPTSALSAFGIFKNKNVAFESQVLGVSNSAIAFKYLEYATGVTAEYISAVQTTYSIGIFEKQTANPQYETSDYIDVESSVKGGLYIRLSDVFSAVFDVVRFYDKNQNVISTIAGGTSSIANKLFKIVFPSGCKYIRYARNVSFQDDGLKVFDGSSFETQVLGISNTKTAFKYFEYATGVTAEYISAVQTTYSMGIFEKQTTNPRYETSDYIDVESNVNGGLYIRLSDVFSAVFDVVRFYDKNQNVISTITGGTEGFANKLFKIVLPAGCKYIRYARNVSFQGDGLKVFDGSSFETQVREVGDYSFSTNRNIVWCGTSIPTGATFPINASKACGYNCINMSYGSSALRWTNSHPPQAVTNVSGRKLTATVAELENVFRQDVVAGLLSEDELEFWKDHCYERAIIPHIDGTEGVEQVSAIIIDHGFNDRLDIVNELANESSIDWDSRDRATYVGAFNYLVDKIMQANPFVKIIVGGYFQNTYTPYSSDKICYMEKKLAEKYSFPLLDVWNYSGISGEFVAGSNDYIHQYNLAHNTNWEKKTTDDNGNITFLQLFCPDNVHPHSDLTGNANRRLDAVYTKLLRNSL